MEILEKGYTVPKVNAIFSCVKINFSWNLHIILWFRPPIIFCWAEDKVLPFSLSHHFLTMCSFPAGSDDCDSDLTGSCLSTIKITKSEKFLCVLNDEEIQIYFYRMSKRSELNCCNYSNGHVIRVWTSIAPILHCLFCHFSPYLGFSPSYPFTGSEV